MALAHEDVEVFTIKIVVFIILLQFQSLLAIGAIAGGPIAGFFLDRSGRKLTIMLCAVPFVAGWVAIATAKEIPGLYIGRILTGVGAGMASLATPVSRLCIQCCHIVR